jgi:hypothetical protein
LRDYSNEAKWQSQHVGRRFMALDAPIHR